MNKLFPAIIWAALIATTTANADPLNTSAGAGKKIFEANCASCHGSDAHGGGPVSKSLAIKPADLTLIAARRGGKFDDEEIVRKIDGREEIGAHGNRDMPVWGRVFSKNAGADSIGEEVNQGNLLALVDYLKSLQR